MKNLFLIVCFLSPTILYAQNPLVVYCGFAERTDYPLPTIPVYNPGTQGKLISYQTSLGDEVFALVSADTNFSNPNLTDITVLTQNSVGGGFIEIAARGVSSSEKHNNGVTAQVPITRKDQGLYFVRIICGI